MKKTKTPQTVLRRMLILSVCAVILLTAVAAVVSYSIASASDKSNRTEASSRVRPQYASTALILVKGDSSSPSLTTDIDSGKVVKTNDISSDIMLANTFAALLKTDQRIKAIAGGETLNITPVENSYLIRITAVTDDPHKSAMIANDAADTAQDIFADYFGNTGDIRVVESAGVPTNPSNTDADTQSDSSTDTLFIVLIASLGTLAVSITAAILLTAAVYTSCRKKYNANNF